MTEQQIVLTSDEREFLVNLLQSVSKQKLVEEHRTRAPSYRGLVIQEEELIGSILNKLGGQSA